MQMSNLPPLSIKSFNKSRGGKVPRNQFDEMKLKGQRITGTRHCLAVLLLVFVVIIGRVEAFGPVTTEDDDNHRSTKGRQGTTKMSNFRRPTDHLTSLPITSKISNISVGSSPSLINNNVKSSETALRLSGDTSFARELKKQEEEEERRQLQQQRQDQQQQQKRIRKRSFSPPLYASFVVLSLASVLQNGSVSMILKDIIPKSISILTVAWLPVLFLNASWIEFISFATLFAQPTIRSFLITEFLPDIWSTLKKMALGELWKRLWASILAPLPKPLFTPILKDYYKLGDNGDPAARTATKLPSTLPSWFQRGWERINEAIEKFTQGLIRKSVEKSVHNSLGVLYEGLTNSILEVSIMYQEESSPRDDDTTSSSLSSSSIPNSYEETSSSTNFDIHTA